MKREEIKEGVLIRFDSWGEAVGIMSRPYQYPVPYHSGACDLIAAHGSLGDALHMAKFGYDEGREKIKRLSMDSFNQIAGLIEQHNPTYDLEGIAVDVGRFLGGEPECFLKFETQHLDGISGRSLRVLYNMDTKMGRGRLDTVGATVAALTELLEYAGFNVSLDITTSSSLTYDKGGKSLTTVFPVKEMGQPLDLCRMSFIVHHAMFWTFALPLQRRSMTAPELASSKLGCNAGAMAHTPKTLIDASDIYIDKGAILHTDSKQFLRETLEAQGVKLKEVAV